MQGRMSAGVAGSWAAISEMAMVALRQSIQPEWMVSGALPVGLIWVGEVTLTMAGGRFIRDLPRWVGSPRVTQPRYTEGHPSC